MKTHKQKMVAPIIVSVLLALYYVIYFGVLIGVLDGVLKYLLGVIPLALVFLTVKVCVERIHEIEKGEEDDLSQY